MNNYIVLDGKKYKTIAKQWNPVGTKANTIRLTLLGEVDVTFGSGTIEEWQGQIEGPVFVPDSSWGTIFDLRTSLRKPTEVVMTDHLGTSFDVACVGPFKEESFTNIWDGEENHFNVTARIIKVRQR